MKRINARYSAQIKINADLEMTDKMLPIDEIRKNWSEMSNYIRDAIMDGITDEGITMEIEEQVSEVNEVDNDSDQ